MKRELRVTLLLLAMTTVVAAAQRKGVTHQLALPTQAELKQAVDVMKSDSRWPANARIMSMGLQEQPKDSLLAYPNGEGPRAMHAVAFDAATQTTYEIAVDVRRRRVAEVVVRNRVQPALTQRDADRADSVVRAHQGWQQALVRRGLSPNDVANVCYASGSPITGFPQRLAFAVTYQRSAEGARYDAPVEGLRCLVDVMNGRVMLLNDAASTSDAAPLTLATKTKEQTSSTRLTLSGRPTWTYANGRLQWRGWTCSPMLTPHEGLVLYDVRRTLDDTTRRIAWRLSLSELFTARLDSTGRPSWQQEFLVGEHGLGTYARTLARNADVPSYATLLSTAAVTDAGDVRTLQDVIAIYERDAGTSWQGRPANNARNPHAYTREQVRELVVLSTARIHGLEYTVAYVLRTDGSLTVDVGVDGSVPTSVPRTYHAACVRMDVDVHGAANSIDEIDMLFGANQVASKDVFSADTFGFRYEQEARRRRDDATFRSWRVTGADNAAYTVAYDQPSVLPMLQQTGFRRRTEFMGYDTWTTAYNPVELFAAGPYPNQADDVGGLPLFVKNNSAIGRRDIVLWHSMGLITAPSASDVPYMRTRHASVTLLPSDGIVTR
ncbi:MAG: hypothetical protein FGM24_04545 [Candidatus Kapabacteria bacterium]|nr:hypothetical protein [Candidatus Kapabacteria bacterium]